MMLPSRPCASSKSGAPFHLCSTTSVLSGGSAIFFRVESARLFRARFSRTGAVSGGFPGHLHVKSGSSKSSQKSPSSNFAYHTGSARDESERRGCGNSNVAYLMFNPVRIKLPSPPSHARQIPFVRDALLPVPQNLDTLALER
eukprot:4878394-Prymnesium_polylepis.1